MVKHSLSDISCGEWGKLYTEATVRVNKNKITLPYLPVYNAHPCIMCTLIFGTFSFEKKFVIKNPPNQKPKPTLDKHAFSVSTV